MNWIHNRAMVAGARWICQVYCVLWLSLVAATLCAQQPIVGLTSAEIEAVDEAVLAEMERQEAVGVAVGIIREGHVVYVQGYGYADRDNEVPVTEQTMFRWASISKPVTAVAAMQLVEQGRLDLDADIRQYVPEFPEQEKSITARQLLCHQGGVVHYRNGPVIRTQREYDVDNPFESVILALDTFKESPLVNLPGEKYSYTTHGYILLSAVVERAGEQPFFDQVRERINQPLKLTTLQPDYQWLDIPNRAVGYRKRDDQIVRSGNTDVSWKLGGGGFISTVGDLAGFGAGVIRGDLVSEDTAQNMWTRQRTEEGSLTGYGLGFQIRGRGNGLRVAHGGSQQKTRTSLVTYPRQGFGYAVMTNSEHANPGRFVSVIEAALNEVETNDEIDQEVGVDGN